MRTLNVETFKKFNSCHAAYDWAPFHGMEGTIIDLMNLRNLTDTEKIWCLTRTKVIPFNIQIDLIKECIEENVGDILPDFGLDALEAIGQCGYISSDVDIHHIKYELSAYTATHIYASQAEEIALLAVYSLLGAIIKHCTSTEESSAFLMQAWHQSWRSVEERAALLEAQRMIQNISADADADPAELATNVTKKLVTKRKRFISAGIEAGEETRAKNIITIIKSLKQYGYSASTTK